MPFGWEDPTQVEHQKSWWPYLACSSPLQNKPLVIKWQKDFCSEAPLLNKIRALYNYLKVVLRVELGPKIQQTFLLHPETDWWCGGAGQEVYSKFLYPYRVKSSQQTTGRWEIYRYERVKIASLLLLTSTWRLQPRWLLWVKKKKTSG